MRRCPTPEKTFRRNSFVSLRVSFVYLRVSAVKSRLELTPEIFMGSSGFVFEQRADDIYLALAASEDFAAGQ